MKLYLFGGAEIGQGQVRAELKLIEKEIERIRPKQVLHVPFARIIASEEEWSGDWFKKYMHIPGITYLNAAKKSDIAKARSPLIFVSGGSQHINLIKKVRANRRLLNLIKHADFYIGESAGSMFTGEYFRSGGADGPRRILPGLGILKKTIIIPHYTERKLQSVLKECVKHTKAKIGIGIDCVTAIELDTDTFPKKYKKFGWGRVKIIKS